jgi:hypothetical protein
MWRTSDAESYFPDSAVTDQESSEYQTSEVVPRPQELFLEAGAVLAGALGLALGAGWLLAMGIPG